MANKMITEEKLYSQSLTNECMAESLQKELREIKSAIPEVMELINLPTLKIYEKYKYTKWSEMPDIIRIYLKNRYNFELYNSTFGLYKGHNKLASINECLGKSFERYNVQNSPFVKRTLADFTQEQLSEMIEQMIVTLNEKKEREAVSCAEK